MYCNAKIIFFLAMLGALTTPGAAAAPGYSISMSTRGDKTLEPITAQCVKVESVVVGGVASTRFDIDFYNPNDRVLEGTFTLPLAPGWELGKFELDINGKLRAAVPVPKSTGRQAFNAVKRRGIDPALIEQQAENLFTARVYPFAARGHRRVVITLDHALLPEKEGAVFEMPYTFENALDKLSVTIRVVERPATSARIEGLDGATFLPGRNEAVWRYEQTEAKLKEKIRIHLPQPTRQPIVTAKDGEGYIYAVFTQPPQSELQASKPSTISIVWDASGSAGRADLAKAKELLKEHLAWVKNCELELITFNVSSSQPQRFSIRNGNCDALLRAIDAIEYDGATDLNCVPWRKLNGDEVLLYSDGLQSWPQAAAQPKVRGKLHTISSGPTRNAQWLQQASLAHGGQHVELTALTVPTASKLLRSGPQVVTSIQPKGGVRYSFPVLVGPRGAWLFGATDQEPSEVKVVQRSGSGKPWETTLAKSSGQTVWQDADIASLLRRRYAQQEMARLRSQGKVDEAEAMAHRYGIATEKTSLIVLEDVKDYVRYAIEPPQELKKEYEAQLGKNKLNEDSAAKMRLESLVRQSEEQSKWWRGEVARPEEDAQEAPLRPDRVRGLRTYQLRSADVLSADGSYAMADGSISEENQKAEDTPDKAQLADQRSGSVSLEAWDSETPYLKVLEYAERAKQKATYYKLKGEYGSIPSFYLDAGGFFEKQGEKAFAYQVLTNLLEMELGSTELHRALAQALERLGMLREAETVYRKIAEDAAYEPQSFRDLALVCEAQGKLQEAVDLFYKVATGAWEQRFNGVDLICMNELNGLLMRHGTQGVDLSKIDKRLIKREPVDVRVVLTWSNDDTDVDLHVTLPDGEECYFGRQLTSTLGKLSNDITQGYGPEEFMHRKGAQGEYLIRARLYADHTQGSVVPKYVRAVCYLHYGSPEEERHELLFRLTGAQESVKVGSIRFK